MNAETGNTLSVLVNADEYTSAVEGIANSIMLFDFVKLDNLNSHASVTVTVWNQFRSGMQYGSSRSVRLSIYFENTTIGQSKVFTVGGVDLSQDARRVQDQLREWVRLNGDQFGFGVL